MDGDKTEKKSSKKVKKQRGEAGTGPVGKKLEGKDAATLKKNNNKRNKRHNRDKRTNEKGKVGGKAGKRVTKKKEAEKGPKAPVATAAPPRPSSSKKNRENRGNQELKSKGETTKVCKFGAKCSKKNCKFIHPSKGSVKGSDSTKEKKTKKGPDIDRKPVKKDVASNRRKKKCKFGVKCNAKNCKFEHPEGRKLKDNETGGRSINRMSKKGKHEDKKMSEPRPKKENLGYRKKWIIRDLPPDITEEEILILLERAVSPAGPVSGGDKDVENSDKVKNNKIGDPGTFVVFMKVL